MMHYQSTANWAMLILVYVLTGDGRSWDSDSSPGTHPVMGADK